MKLNKIMMAAVLAFGVTSVAHAADQGHGTVTFKGSIIDAPCSITPETVDQTVNLGQVSNVALKDGGQSTPKNFQVKLENCELTDKAPGKNNAVTITFTGASSVDDTKLLGITGTAKGAGIAITDGAGKLIELGKASSAQSLGNGSNTLSFAAYLQGSKASNAVVTPGDFQSVADFTLAYQ
ncbi:Fimbria A protein precursor [Serratia marcescens]|jgi:P pilus assembly protein, pilin FimA|uniref:fimbrial protein n=1 Tax=Serratia marcescens TaxID=615 RepID=UPI000E1CF25F|nr:fimbrial protein [Serratia marcescens]AXK22111.1 Type-1 fimbrial protein, A chain precursor [Serratia marcescens]MBH2526189.1 type 1 fimbrial protein [Serratia marcescens]MBH2888059.1 type 1 fimbrial protein [Serratia marcescens]MBH3137833.1 type 1 fimbrial protein [Serratia marcescens]MDU4305575.1 fimbrial protein [Serratia marcescens]